MTPTGESQPKRPTKMGLQRFLAEFDKSVEEMLDSLIRDRQINCNDTIDMNYWNTYATTKYMNDTSVDAATLAKFAAESILRHRALDIVKSKTIELRDIPVTDEKAYNACADQIDNASKIYNELMGKDSLRPVNRRTAKPQTESVSAPNMIVFGRQYDEPSVGEGSVVDRFNAMVAQADPFTGTSNAVMQRLAEYAHNNASKYSVDDEPELDEYVTTLFIDPDMGPEAFEINGENPYRVLEKIKDGDSIEITKAPIEQAPKNEEPGINDDFLASFGKVFNS